MVFSKRIPGSSRFVWQVRTKLQARFPGITPKSFLQSLTGAAATPREDVEGAMTAVACRKSGLCREVFLAAASSLVASVTPTCKVEMNLNGPTFKIYKLELFPFELKFLRSFLDSIVWKPAHKQGNYKNITKMVKKYYIGKINNTHTISSCFQLSH